jgi:uncharacterized protein (DUF1778 family)
VKVEGTARGRLGPALKAAHLAHDQRAGFVLGLGNPALTAAAEVVDQKMRHIIKENGA